MVKKALGSAQSANGFLKNNIQVIWVKERANLFDDYINKDGRKKYLAKVLASR